MTIFTSQRVGGASGRFSHQAGIISGVFDLAESVADDSFASLDSMTLVNLPAGTLIESFDAEIVEALNGTVTAVDMGTDTDTDPDNYINNNSDTAVGRFTTYEAASIAQVVIITATALYVRVTFSGTPTTGKIAWQVKIQEASKNALNIAKPHVYTNI